jgi:hypothetical protein
LAVGCREQIWTGTAHAICIINTQGGGHDHLRLCKTFCLHTFPTRLYSGPSAQSVLWCQLVLTCMAPRFKSKKWALGTLCLRFKINHSKIKSQIKIHALMMIYIYSLIFFTSTF